MLFLCEIKVAVQNHKIVILAGFRVNLSPVRCWWNEIRYPRDFNTNSRCLIRIWRSWGLVGARKRKQGAARVGAGVDKICKHMKIGKSCKMGLEWWGELETGAK